MGLEKEAEPGQPCWPGSEVNPRNSVETESRPVAAGGGGSGKNGE